MTGCRALGAEEVYDEFRKQIKKQKLQDKVEVIETGCQGLCARAPVMTIEPPGVFMAGLQLILFRILFPVQF